VTALMVHFANDKLNISTMPLAQSFVNATP